MIEERRPHDPLDPIAGAFPREDLPAAFVARTMARVRADRRERPARHAPPLRDFGLDAVVAAAGAIAIVAVLWGLASVASPGAWDVVSRLGGGHATWLAAALVFGAGASGMALAAWLASPPSAPLA